ncbi:MAG: hypothetical protein ACYS76_09085 [Planctomycetota bacterium]|jgi:hypothetical protein
MKKVTRILFTGLLCLAAGFVVGSVFLFGKLSPAHAGHELFRKAYRGGPSKSLKQCIQAGGALAKLKGAEPWMVLLVLDTGDPDYELVSTRITHKEPILSEYEESRLRATLQRYQKGIMAEAVRNVPEDANKAVLWAVAAKLLDTGRGIRYFTHKWGPITVVKTHGSTEPIQEMALDTLKRCLGVDYGYDPILWREAILKKED